MHAPWKNLTPVVAGSVSLIFLSGCPNAGTQPPVTPQGSASSVPSQAPSSLATTDAGANPSTTVSPATGASQTPGATESPSASAAPLPVTTLQGKVYDEAGALVSDAKVRVRSLSSTVKFDTTVDTTGGAYVVNGVPSGTQIEISVTKPNWTTRSRVESLVATSINGSVVNFGGPSGDAQDSSGAGYFISNFPEITSAGASYDGAKLVYTLRFSEPLDADNQRRVERGLAITAPDPNGGFITIRSGTTFLGDRFRATSSWDETGTTMTFTFEAPLLTSKSDKKNYSLTLSRAEGEDPIKDAQGNVLGMTTPNSGASYAEAFKLSSLVLTNETTGQARWATTHTGSSSFTVAKDDQGPKLVSVSSTPFVQNGVDSVRFILTFNEPMRVFPEATGFSTATNTLANYIFALSDRTMEGMDMTGTVTATANTAADIQLNQQFKFGGTSNATVSFSDTDPKVVTVVVPRSVIPTTAKYFKVRLDAVQDPAGNVISTAGASATDRTADNIKSGSL